MDGLIHLYELDETKKLNLMARLYLPQSKHRWLTSYSIVLTRQNSTEFVYLIGGDKCGNLNLYKIETGEKKFSLNHPIQSIKNLTKDNTAISAIYSKCCLKNDTDGYFNYVVICCCKDGFYRVFEFNSESLSDFEESVNSLELLRLVNKYQINSYVDIIESILFEPSNDTNAFDLENDLKLAFCFYGDKFLLWNFQLNRALFEFKCGGANRSWDYEFCSTNSGELLFRFIYIKNKTIGEARKLLGKSEIERSVFQKKNNICQVFHGNNITLCKYITTSEYLLTGSEDTQLILNR